MPNTDPDVLTKESTDLALQSRVGPATQDRNQKEPGRGLKGHLPQSLPGLHTPMQDSLKGCCTHNTLEGALLATELYQQQSTALHDLDVKR